MEKERLKRIELDCVSAPIVGLDSPLRGLYVKLLHIFSDGSTYIETYRSGIVHLVKVGVTVDEKAVWMLPYGIGTKDLRKFFSVPGTVSLVKSSISGDMDSWREVNDGLRDLPQFAWPVKVVREKKSVEVIE